MSHPPFLTHPDFSTAGMAHGFFTREGGVSAGLYQSLNCSLSSQDDPAHVEENRARVAAAMGVAPGRLLTVYQTHSTDVQRAEAPWPVEVRPRGDALVTATPGLALAISTADCAPVLFTDDKARVIGAAHAGWKGALGGILENTLAAMETLGARRERIRAVIGACIQRASYEVGPEFPAPFRSHNPADAVFFTPAEKPGHFRFDLPGYCAERLRRAGTGAVASLGVDTYADARFFSHRRRTHRGEPDMGLMLSAIVLR